MSTNPQQDGATFLLREDQFNIDELESMSHILTVCLKDGLIMCFYMVQDGTIHLQVTHPKGKTFELTSNGAVLIFPTTIEVKERTENLSQRNITNNSKDVREMTFKQEAQLGVSDDEKGGKKGGKPRGKNVEILDATKTPKTGAAEMTGKEEKKGKKKVKAKAKASKGLEDESEAHMHTECDINLRADDNSNNLLSTSTILQKERGEEEFWRCVLPSGTVVRYRENEDLQVST